MKNYYDTIQDILQDYYKEHGYPPLPCDIDPGSEEVE